MKISIKWANGEIDSYGDTKEKKLTSLRQKYMTRNSNEAVAK